MLSVSRQGCTRALRRVALLHSLVQSSAVCAVCSRYFILRLGPSKLLHCTNLASVPQTIHLWQDFWRAVSLVCHLRTSTSLQSLALEQRQNNMKLYSLLALLPHFTLRAAAQSAPSSTVTNPNWNPTNSTQWGIFAGCAVAWNEISEGDFNIGSMIMI